MNINEMWRYVYVRLYKRENSIIITKPPFSYILNRILNMPITMITNGEIDIIPRGDIPVCDVCNRPYPEWLEIQISPDGEIWINDMLCYDDMQYRFRYYLSHNESMVDEGILFMIKIDLIDENKIEFEYNETDIANNVDGYDIQLLTSDLVNTVNKVIDFMYSVPH